MKKENISESCRSSAPLGARPEGTTFGWLDTNLEPIVFHLENLNLRDFLNNEVLELESKFPCSVLGANATCGISFLYKQILFPT